MFNAKTLVYIIRLGDCDRYGEIMASATDGSGFRFRLLCLTNLHFFNVTEPQFLHPLIYCQFCGAVVRVRRRARGSLSQILSRCTCDAIRGCRTCQVRSCLAGSPAFEPGCQTSQHLEPQNCRGVNQFRFSACSVFPPVSTVASFDLVLDFEQQVERVRDQAALGRGRRQVRSAWPPTPSFNFIAVLFITLLLLSCVRLFATPWTVALQTPLFMGFSKQEFWSGLPFPSPGDLANPGSHPRVLHLLPWQAGSLPLCHLLR